ncbi:Molybdopterin biosynthesis protein MoeA-like protein, partial [Aduncisulcus paluster]
DKPVILRVVSKILAGESGDVSLQRGEAVRIMTGAPIPPACTAVIRQEDTDYGQVNVQINRPVTAYQNYCHAGEDYKEGQILVEKGSRLFPEHLGIIASTGKHEVEVRKKLTVGLLSTGAELTEPGESLEQGQIYNSGQYLIGARIKELGCKLVRLKAFGDDARRTAQEIDQAFDSCDLIVTTGGVSVGEKDIMHPVNEILATEKLFWGIDLKPGTPALASLHKGKLLLGLSGNPNAAG